MTGWQVIGTVVCSLVIWGYIGVTVWAFVGCLRNRNRYVDTEGGK